jgi:hypothetical protein
MFCLKRFIDRPRYLKRLSHKLCKIAKINPLHAPISDGNAASNRKMPEHENCHYFQEETLYDLLEL